MPKTSENSLNVGAVSYLNSKPLIEYLREELPLGSNLSLELPSRLSTQLAQGQIDIGLIPTVEYFRLDHSHGLAIISDACIGCRGPVYSVRLYFRVEPRLVRSIAIDEGSRTSVALASILLHRRYGLLSRENAECFARYPSDRFAVSGLSTYEFTSLPIEANPDEVDADAVLVIGDRAMHPTKYRSFSHNWDLGEEWFKETGLPFVFAAWIGRQDLDDPKVASSFENARDAGLKEVDHLVDKYSGSYGLTTKACYDYFTKYLRFKLDFEMYRGLNAFHQAAKELNLVPNGITSSDPASPVIAAATPACMKSAL